MEDKKKILLIGGSGIISSCICNLAIKEGMQVTIVNRGKRKKFINPGANLIIADVRNESVEELQSKINVAEYDVVMDFITYNTQQLKKIIQIVGNYCRQYIFVSSATVYRDEGKNHIYNEQDAIGNESWQYSIEKSQCEWYLEKNKALFDFEYTVVRPYVTYGVTRIPYQIAPLEYYTVINRILMKKPIPITGLNTQCTVTNSDEFAVGAVGLFLNKEAYGEAVHITASCSTTWKNIIDIIARRYNVNVTYIDIPMEYLEKQKNLGFDYEELKGDKSRNMIFDNAKIKKLVPEFKGEVKIEDSITKILDFYDNNKNNRKINYIWDGRIDKLINMYSKNYFKNKEKASFKQYINPLSFKDKLKYFIGRYEIPYILCKKGHEIQKSLKK